MIDQLYGERSANFPRLATDSFFANYENRFTYSGRIEDSFRFIEEKQLLDRKTWARFVNQFRIRPETWKWRGEYWGKMMRGACLVYSSTRNPELYEVLRESVEDMLTCQDEQGRISSYKEENELSNWDLWCRKYVLLGMQYFIEICEDEELCARLVESMCRQVDYLMERIGSKEEGKKPITSTSKWFRGLNSSSILEPIVRLYSLTGEKKYLDFSTHIVERGGTRIFNIFEAAYRNDIPPYQYPITKAYEMMSCFEGLLEYYRVTGIEKHKVAVVNFVDRLLESDFTVIGGAGCTVEMLDHSTYRQSCRNTGDRSYVQQETCVTVTLMKLLYQAHLLTGDPRYADAFERSFYNAYLGVLNTEGCIGAIWRFMEEGLVVEPLPFDSCSPMVSDKRGNSIDGICVMSDMHYYGCCACIGAAGMGLVSKMQLLNTRRGLALNLYIDGSISARTPKGKKIGVKISTEYPKTEKIEMAISLEESESFELLLRNPEWSKTTAISVNGKAIGVTEGYVAIEREWKDGDHIEMTLDMRTQVIRPVIYGGQMICAHWMSKEDYVIPEYDIQDEESKRRLAFRRGPLMLAQENRFGYDVDIPVDIDAQDKEYVETPITEDVPFEHFVAVKLPLKSGGYMTVTDYASAGKLWSDETKLSVWILTDGEEKC